MPARSLTSINGPSTTTATPMPVETPSEGTTTGDGVPENSTAGKEAGVLAEGMGHPEREMWDEYPRLSYRNKPNARRCGVCKTKMALKISFGHPLSDMASAIIHVARCTSWTGHYYLKHLCIPPDLKSRNLGTGVSTCRCRSMCWRLDRSLHGSTSR